MKRSKEDALRWLKQSEHDLLVAKSNLGAGFYSDACFMCEQSAQKALKSYLIFKTGRPVLWERSVQILAKRCLQFEEGFKEVVDYGRILDRYYIPTRYPNALTPPAVPYETYTEKDALEAVRFAEKIIEVVKIGFEEEK
jgi:HEPN domain-containing protein